MGATSVRTATTNVISGHLLTVATLTSPALNKAWHYVSQETARVGI